MSLVATSALRRVAATAVDALVLFVPYAFSLSDAAPEPARVAAAAAVPIVMGAQAWTLARSGRTIGKRLWRQRVVRRSTGENAGALVNALARPLAAWAPNVLCVALKTFPVWIAFDALAMVWRDDGLSLHDLICGTRVVDEPRADS